MQKRSLVVPVLLAIVLAAALLPALAGAPVHLPGGGGGWPSGACGWTSTCSPRWHTARRC
jgi:hypothetical protein